MPGRAAALAILAVMAAASGAGAEPMPVARLAAGATHIEKGVPFAVSVTRPAVTASAGARMTDRASAHLRLDWTRFDGNEVQLSLAVEHALHRYVGVLGAAGIAGNDPSRLGAILTLGGFGRLAMSDRVDLRLEALYQRTRRSDFGGGRTAVSLGAEMSF